MTMYEYPVYSVSSSTSTYYNHPYYRYISDDNSTYPYTSTPTYPPQNTYSYSEYSSVLQKLQEVLSRLDILEKSFVDMSRLIWDMASEDCISGGDCGSCLPCRAREAMSNLVFAKMIDGLKS